jgi:hypothetical protein
MVKSIFFRNSLLAICFLTIALCAHAGEIPPFRTEWGFYGNFTGTQGMRVNQISPQSPAATAGLQAGDVITALNGEAVKGYGDFARPPYVPVDLQIDRQGARIERTIIPGGLVRLEVRELETEFSIPGVPVKSDGAAPISAIKALDYINVLDQVVLDPASGQVAMIGHYDANYLTGNIPYLDLLKSAMVHPTPVLNLIPTPQTMAELKASEGRFNDFKQMVDIVRGHPELERDRQLMIRELAKGYSLTPEQYAAWYNWVKLCKDKDVFPPPPIRDIQIKVFANLGYDEVARALAFTFENTINATVRALEVLGQGNEADAILGRNSDAEATLEALRVSVYLSILQTATAATPEQVVALRTSYDAGNATWDQVLKTVQNALMPYSRKDSAPGRAKPAARSQERGPTDAPPDWSDPSNLMNAAFNNIILSSGAVMFLEGFSTPYATIVPLELDGRSQLARIMYEADYALKSINVRPELFEAIPGSRNRTVYEFEQGLYAKRDAAKKINYRQWLEPEMVDMTVSPDNSVISFKASRMLYHFADDSQGWGRPPDPELAQDYAPWCAQVMSHYDAYAHVVPAFHKIREVAKVIALANWARGRNISFDLKSVRQEEWDMPGTVQAFFYLGKATFHMPDGTSICRTPRAFEGGVTFKKIGNWTQITPSTSTITEVSSQLTLSSQLGRQAVHEAAEGDLEQARYLAELSAQAMTGSLSSSDLLELNIVLPPAQPAPAAPANVQLQREMLKQTDKQIRDLSQNADERQAREALGHIGRLYDQIAANPVAASDYLLKLQTSQFSTPPGVPTPTDASIAVWAPCSESALHVADLTAERRAFFELKLREARDRLQYINTALKNLITIQAAQQAEIDMAIRDISAAYDESVDRAWSVVFDLLISLPADKFLDNYAVAKSKLEHAIQDRIGRLTTPLDAAGLQKVQGELTRLQTAKARLDDLYQRSARLLEIQKGAGATHDFQNWTLEEQDDYAKIKDGGLLIGKLVLDPALEGYLKNKAFFSGERYWQVAAMGRMAAYATVFFLDILAQQMIWEPMTANLQNNLDDNVRGMETLREKAISISREISCIEAALNKPSI